MMLVFSSMLLNVAILIRGSYVNSKPQPIPFVTNIQLHKLINEKKHTEAKEISSTTHQSV